MVVFLHIGRFVTAFLLVCGLALASQGAAAGETVWAKGVVTGVIMSKQQIKIAHEPVPEWGWKKMKMKFQVAADIDLMTVKKKQTIEFLLERGDDGKAIIIQIKQ